MQATAGSAAKLPLAGRHVVVTRPPGQARPLAEAIERNGGKAVLFPVLEISDTEHPAALLAAVERLEEFDLAVFVSPNAADRALRAITARRPWPPRLRALAMGETSARELERFGVTDVIVPANHSDSEALLERPELQAERIEGKRVAIFRGDGGRGLLGEALAARGARVVFVECYRRRRPAADPAPLLALWAKGELDAVTVTSSEGLRNLLAMAGSAGEKQLKATPLFVAHRRIADEARRLDFSKVEVTGAGDEGLLAGLIAHFGRERE